MKLIVQPDAGIAPVLTAIKQAKKTIDILIFRLDRSEIARALEAAVARGVVVRALTAHTNRGGEKNLRRLEMHLLEEGVTVSRTADDLVRYHGKMMIVDGRILHVYGFNFTGWTSTRAAASASSRGTGAWCRRRSSCSRRTSTVSPTHPAHERLIVSPENSRERLADIHQGRETQLLIYDPGLTDDGDAADSDRRRSRRASTCKIIGKVEAKWRLPCEKFPGKRLHVRAIVRDGQRAFIGSQSLRKLELDKRREVGVIVTDRKVVDEIMAVFARDWAETPTGKKEVKKTAKSLKAGKPVATTERLLAAAVCDRPWTIRRDGVSRNSPSLHPSARFSLRTGRHRRWRRARALATPSHHLADGHRSREDRADRDESPEFVMPATAARPADATQPQLAQSGVPPNWHGVMRVVRSAEIVVVVRAKTHSSGDVRRLRVDVEHALGRFELRIAQAQRHQVGDDALAVGRRETFVRYLADLRRVEADPDLARLPACADQNCRNSSR